MNNVFSNASDGRIQTPRHLSLTILSALAILAAPSLCLGQATIVVIAGTGNPGPNGDGGPAKNAFLDGPESVAVDPSGNLFIRESARVRKVTPAGIITTYAGTGSNGDSGDGGPATSAQLGLGPQRAGLATDSEGNLYIADTNNYRVRKVDTSGKITTVAGTGKLGLGSGGDGGKATDATLCTPTGVAVDHAGNLYIGSSICGGVRKVDTSGIITTVARKSNGPSYGVALDDNGTLYVNGGGVPSQIRKVNGDGSITVIAGTGTGTKFNGDGQPATSANLFEVDGHAIDKDGNVYIADSGNGRIRKVDTAGTITTVAGHGAELPGAGCQNLFSTGCPAINLKFTGDDLAFDKNGNLYTAGFGKGVVYKISGLGSSGPPPTAPVIPANGVVNAASFQPGITASSWVTISGTNLAAKTLTWSHSIVNGKLPTSLDGVSVSIAGKPAYIYFISPTQINVLAPEIPPGPVPITVTNSGGTSNTFNATASLHNPAFFEWPNSQPVATRQDYSYAAKAGTFATPATVPAKPGDVLILWGTGFGPTNPVAPVGVTVPTGKTYSTTTKVIVTVNNIHATVYGAALASGAAGLYQVAIQVPNSLADGDWPIIATIGGVSSPTGVLLTVHH